MIEYDIAALPLQRILDCVEILAAEDGFLDLLGRPDRFVLILIPLTLLLVGVGVGDAEAVGWRRRIASTEG